MTGLPRARAHFVAHQLAELRRLAVTTEQIEELERVLPSCRAMLGAVPRMADVREELLSLQRAMSAASDALVRFDRATSDAPALNEAFTRLHVASFSQDASTDGYPLERAIFALAQVSGWTKAAVAELRPRKNEVSTWPIARVDEALTRGWGRTYYRVFHGDDDRSTVNAAKPPPDFPHYASSGVTSPFRLVVGICYEALGAPNTDPERQIKSYLRWRKARRARGQEGPEELGLPS